MRCWPMILSIKGRILAMVSFLNSEYKSSKTLSDHGRLLLALHLDRHFAHSFNHSALDLSSLQSAGCSNFSAYWHGRRKSDFVESIVYREFLAVEFWARHALCFW